MGRYIAALLFASAAVALLATNILNNATAINDGVLVFNDLTAVVGGMAIAGALLSLSFGAVASRSRLVALAALLTVVGCTITSVHYTLSRIGGVADTSSAQGGTYERQKKLIEAEIADRQADVTTWEQEVAKAEKGIALECKGRPPKSLDRESWPKCRSYDDEADLARANVAKFSGLVSKERQTLRALGAPPATDPAAKRLEALVGLPVATYRNAIPVVTAFSLEGAVNLLFLISGLFMAGGRKQNQGSAEPMQVMLPEHPIEAVIRKSRRALSNGEVARLTGVSDATATRRVEDLVAQGRLIKTRDGRGVKIRLA